MGLDWEDIRQRGIRGVSISEAEALAITALTEPSDLATLFATAGAIRLSQKGTAINTCGITNARSGRCPEKCNFCSQSAHFKTAAPAYTTKDADTIAAEARAAFDMGVREFSIVMSGRAISSRRDLDVLKDAFGQIRAQTGLQTCASLGLMTRANLAELQAAGMQSMHHNLETARSFHAQIVESHTYDDEVETIKAAKSLGMYVCSGGIFGMGESWAHRVELALDLRTLDVDSVPLNFLNPRPGTPLSELKELSPVDCLKIIALYRLVLPTKDLIVCGGRALNLGERQGDIFRAGANGVMLGNYLTTPGPAVTADLSMLAEQGLVVRAPPHQPHPPSVPPAVRSAGTDLGGLADKHLG
jgi:biotin synthase